MPVRSFSEGFGALAPRPELLFIPAIPGKGSDPRGAFNNHPDQNRNQHSRRLLGQRSEVAVAPLAPPEPQNGYHTPRSRASRSSSTEPPEPPERATKAAAEMGQMGQNRPGSGSDRPWRRFWRHQISAPEPGNHQRNQKQNQVHSVHIDQLIKAGSAGLNLFRT